MSDNPMSQSERLTDERRNHNRNLEVLKAEFAPTSEINREYTNHQRRLAEILGPDEPAGIVDGRRVY
jgi:hypothetical protein